MLSITKISENAYSLTGTAEIMKKIRSYFSYFEDGAEYSPAYKMGRWDGKKCLIAKDGTIFAGLYEKLIKYCDSNKIDYKVFGKVASEAHSDYYDWLQQQSITKDGQKVTLWEHQKQAFVEALKRKNRIIISPTSSGKTMVLFLLLKYFVENIDNRKKILFLVPNLSLFEQTLADFKEYAKGSKWNIMENLHTIKAGSEKYSSKQIYFSTWHSMAKMERDYFEKFEAVVVDETHLAAADKLFNIVKFCHNACYRIGVTGSLSHSVGDNLLIESILGPTSQFITTRELIDKNLAANTDIQMLELIYDKETVQKLKRKSYVYEIEKVLENEKRNNFIIELCRRTKGNTMLMFNYVAKHGIPLYNKLKTELKDRNVYYISGMVDPEERERIRVAMEKEENAILIANFATTSTGVSITNIHNLIICSTIASPIRLYQTLGRGLRKGEFKETIKIFDIVDDLRVGKYVNHLYRHGEERKVLYKKENHPFKVTKITL